jgi:hypothetical protein
LLYPQDHRYRFSIVHEPTIHAGLQVGEKFGFGNQRALDITVGSPIYDTEVGGEIALILDFGNVKIAFHYFIDALSGTDYAEFDLCLQGHASGQQQGK